MRQKGAPTIGGEVENKFLVVSALLAVTPPARYRHIARNMQANTETIHAIKVLNCCAVILEISTAV
jgi:hypothetical protein